VFTKSHLNVLNSVPWRL